YRLSMEAVRRILAELIARTHAQRRELVGLESGREDLILAGTLILAESMERFGFAECLVSDYGLREGVLIDRWQKSKGRVASLRERRLVALRVGHRGAAGHVTV